MHQNLPFPTTHLCRWFQENRRDLPWRGTPSPYHVLVSEIMLQQTQAAVVIPYFLRWMQKFPTLQALASASLDDVILCWEGLGYYSRARSLHKIAQRVIADGYQELPNDPAYLSTLAGIGPYTLGALLSFAFHKKAPAVDGNVIRVLSRYFKIDQDVTLAKTKKQLEEICRDLLPDVRPYIAMEALIELGALVCKKKPLCGVCPLNSSCLAHAIKQESLYPIKPKPSEAVHLHRAVAVISCNEHYLVFQEEAGKVMAGLWQFPYLEVPPLPTYQFQSLFEAHLEAPLCFHEPLPLVQHSFTKYRVKLTPLYFSIKSPITQAPYQWIHEAKLSELPFSSGHRRIAANVKSLHNDLRI